MPVLGERKSAQFGRGYTKDPMYGLAAEFKSMAENVLEESGFDFFAEPTKAMMNASAEEAIKNFYVLEDSKKEIGNGIVLCMIDNIFPIDSNNYYVPIEYI